MDLTDLTNPVIVVLTIGTDSGTTAVTAEFEKRKKHHEPDDDRQNNQPDENSHNEPDDNWHEHE